LSDVEVYDIETWETAIKLTLTGANKERYPMTENLRKNYMMASSATESIQTTNPLENAVQQLEATAAAAVTAIAKRKKRDAEEFLLMPNPQRFVIFPIQHDDIWKKYKDHISVFWRPEEVDLSKDMRDWNTMTEKEQHFIKRILGFFACADGIVMENLAQRFMTEIQIPEAKFFYGIQMMMETVHSEMYSQLIDTYIEDRAEKNEILQSIQTIPCIQKKAEWALTWLNSEEADFPTRIMAFAAVEGIFFSGAFCSIFWLKQRGLMPGLTASNEFIARDEGLHTDFACLLYSKCKHRLPKTKAHKLIREAVRIEKGFITDALPCSLIGMSGPRMGEYIEFIADRLLVSLGYPKIWDTANPFPWMERISLEGKDNFFEKRVTNYALAGVGSDSSKSIFSLGEEF
jgi:ribonucleoside-diphosphate reductase beta chain